MSNFKNLLMQLIHQHNEGVTELREAEIPPIIHRIWLGSAMPENTFQTLLHFQNHMQKSGTLYVHNLWTYSVEDAGLREQIATLQKSGMKVSNMAEIWDDRSEIGNAVKKWIKMGEQEPAHYKIASDIFRMYVLYVLGGIYMDVYRPLLVSVSPFNDLFEAAGGDLCAYIAFEYSLFMEKNYGWNYFFASVPGNSAIEKMLQEVCGGDGQRMTANLVDRLLAEMSGVKEEKGRALFDYAFAPLDLQYCTRASVEK